MGHGTPSHTETDKHGWQSARTVTVPSPVATPPHADSECQEDCAGGESEQHVVRAHSDQACDDPDQEEYDQQSKAVTKI